jgi:hypothetical protein
MLLLLYPRNRTLVHTEQAGWAGPRASSNIPEKIKVSYPCQDYLSLIKIKIKISRHPPPSLSLSLSLSLLSNHSAVSHMKQAVNIHSCFFVNSISMLMT